MKTIELSNQKARRLADFLAPQWANIATQVAAIKAGVNVNTPWLLGREGLGSPVFRARVEGKRKEAALIAEVLAGIGATVPEVDASQFVVPYSPPWASAAHKCCKQISMSKLRDARARLIVGIKSQVR